ncbi:recombinase family protein [Ructibacterium gallinarum]|uniref:Recombinase family protein n=1 Tax=Ructibacterium gallinarum TaxID=2779355 RepID=A0A9D5LXN1_9FIRM|nr:recombinase family protein [Ructibacterium gallinarum]MBE5039798.1 recombinase family protein [Ructibacterium gallinarum]
MQRDIKKLDVKIPSLPKAKQVAAYARVSSEKDAMLHSLSAQISYYSQMIQSHNGWIYRGVYSDEAKTGTKESRQGFQDLLAECRAGRIDMVITKSISRFARNTVTLLETVRELKAMGVDVFFEEQNIHSISTEGEFLLTLLASYAQEESLSASENQKWQIRKAFEKGELVNIRFMYGFHVEKGSMLPHPKQATIVDELYDRLLAYESCSSIAKDLERRGIRGVLGGKWTATRVIEIIKNEKNVGDSLGQKKYRNNHLDKKLVKNRGELPMYYAEGTHTGIVDSEKFEKAQRILEERKRNRKPAKPITHSVFTSLIYCPHCGKNYRKVTTNGSVGWNCPTYISDGKDVCFGKKIPDDTLSKVTAEVLQMAAFDPQAVSEQIRRIIVPQPNHLVFEFKNGRHIEKVWADRSRKDSWTPEMKEAARQKALKRHRGESVWQEK